MCVCDTRHFKQREKNAGPGESPLSQMLGTTNVLGLGAVQIVEDLHQLYFKHPKSKNLKLVMLQF